MSVFPQWLDARWNNTTTPVFDSRFNLPGHGVAAPARRGFGRRSGLSAHQQGSVSAMAGALSPFSHRPGPMPPAKASTFGQVPPPLMTEPIDRALSQSQRISSGMAAKALASKVLASKVLASKALASKAWHRIPHAGPRDPQREIALGAVDQNSQPG